jgi:hypothetical protein
LRQFRLGVAPGEVRVRLRITKLGQTLHNFRPRKGLGQKDHVRVIALHFSDTPFPERKRFGVRIVDAEDPHALVDPVDENAL